MARTTPHPPASRQVGVENRRTQCAACAGPARADYRVRRSVVTLEAVVALRSQLPELESPWSCYARRQFPVQEGLCQ